MKTILYSKNDFGFFPFYPYSVGSNYLQEKIERKNGLIYHQLFIINCGSGILEINNEIIKLEKGDLFFISANVPHTYYGTSDDFKTGWIAFSGDDFYKVLKYYSLNNYGIFKSKNNGNFELELRNFYNSFDKIHKVSTLCKITYSAIITFFDEAKNVEYSPIQQVYNYIEENYAKPITLDDLSAIYQFSKTKLCLDFKKEYNGSIFDVLTKIRLKHANTIICITPNINLKDVANMCGFNDTSYFCKMYKRVYGKSPKE